MLLAEAVAEKEHLKKSINSLIHSLVRIMESEDKPKNVLSKKLDKLDELYRKYQQFEITTNRAKFQIKIQINDMELTLAEAMALKEAMSRKVDDFDLLLSNAIDSADIEILSERLDEIRRDVKTLDAAINHAMWSTEI